MYLQSKWIASDVLDAMYKRLIVSCDLCAKELDVKESPVHSTAQSDVGINYYDPLRFSWNSPHGEDMIDKGYVSESYASSDAEIRRDEFPVNRILEYKSLFEQCAHFFSVSMAYQLFIYLTLIVSYPECK